MNAIRPVSAHLRLIFNGCTVYLHERIARAFAPRKGDDYENKKILFGGARLHRGNLVTRTWQPLVEPDVEENKYYVPGIGLIVEINPDTGGRVELELFTPAPKYD